LTATIVGISLKVSLSVLDAISSSNCSFCNRSVLGSTHEKQQNRTDNTRNKGMKIVATDGRPL
ncbi:hypothetical protein, partial [Klebsiella pneumoniae]|uniref:hypothetical protein n=1 Tax=Klebsiella pneumoniae TaxID=573 RepID=UPI0025A2ED19